MNRQGQLWSAFVLTIALIGFSSGLVVAQTTTATISGTVKDETGGVIPGIQVTVTNLDTGIVRSLVSDDAGRYRASQLEVGAYEVKGELTGFQTSIRKGIELSVGRSAVVDLTMRVGEISDQVTSAASGSWRRGQCHRHIVRRLQGPWNTSQRT